MRVLVGMSGGVDSSVAALMLRDAGHEVVGATMKLWGGETDSGCCSLAEVQDARRVADQLGIDHHVFNYSAEFDEHVVRNFVDAHASARTPNPCVECNRSIKFGSFLERARRLGFDAIATGHYARVEHDGSSYQLRRAVDPDKDQSYVLSVLGQSELARTLFPIGSLEKADVRKIAEANGLRTANKADSQDLCFIGKAGGGTDRAAFLSTRVELHRGVVVEQQSGAVIGEIDAVELVTVGQRRGLGHGALGERQYALRVDVDEHKVYVGSLDELAVEEIGLSRRTWVVDALAVGSPISVQLSAHGASYDAVVTSEGVGFDRPTRRVAPGQVVACYVGDRVVGSGIAM